ncbi:hypothetical protein LSUE1_G002659 [Lachnellula suecica]|uniref:Uncharacterized protein n=1 Tax=Lachnellula suecica TaxID=602035 RepID=A0A8T9CGX8_9HELO|nr:hypothetical protein LSUE1_G002659 [Lachnellula suecica]
MHRQKKCAEWPQFLDRALTKVKKDNIRSIARVPASKTGPIEKGEKLDADFGFPMQVTVLENTPSMFEWAGQMLYLFLGEHTFGFEPSKITPGGTTFMNKEEFFRLMHYNDYEFAK